MTGDPIPYRTVYSSRRTIAISITAKGEVIVRLPWRTSAKSAQRLVESKKSWILKHLDDFRKRKESKPARRYADGEVHLFRGKEHFLRVVDSPRPFCNFGEGFIEIGIKGSKDAENIRSRLYTGYKKKAGELFPLMLAQILERFSACGFRPTGLVIRTMKSRWGSCTSRGVITLNTELVRLPDRYAEYVIIHELCHLMHHNHGDGFYRLLTELYPDWKCVRKELRSYL